MSDQYQIKQTTSLCEEMYRLYNEGKYTDFVIRSEDNIEIPCHRVVIAAASEVFDMMLSVGMSEMYTGKVDLPAGARTTKLILEYIYRGKYTVDKSSIAAVYKLANYLKLSTLVSKCEDFLKKEMDPSFCFDIWKIAKLHESHEISGIAKSVLLRSFSRLCNQDTAEDISLEELKELVTDPYINCTSELKCTCAWIWFVCQDSVSGKKCEEVVITLINAPNVENNDIKQACSAAVDNLDSSNVEKIPKLREMWEKACQKLIWGPEGAAPFVASAYMKDECLIILGGEVDSNKNSLTAFNFKKKTWHKLNADKTNFGYRFALCSDNGIVYISGGTMSMDQRNFMSYDPEEGRWRNLPAMFSGREQHSMCVVNDCIYVLGGYSKDKAKLWDADKYVFGRKTWERAGEVARPVSAASAAVLDSCIYLLGGSIDDDHRSPSTFVQCFDTSREYSWIMDFSLPFKSKKHSMVAVTVDDAIYMVYKGDVYVYHLKQKAECIGKIEKAPINGFGVVAFGNQLLILGGEDDNFGNKENLIQFDVKAKQAVTLPERTPWKMKDFGFTKTSLSLGALGLEFMD